jgi:hypothetical protein
MYSIPITWPAPSIRTIRRIWAQLDDSGANSLQVFCRRPVPFAVVLPQIHRNPAFNSLELLFAGVSQIR